VQVHCYSVTTAQRIYLSDQQNDELVYQFIVICTAGKHFLKALFPGFEDIPPSFMASLISRNCYV